MMKSIFCKVMFDLSASSTWNEDFSRATKPVGGLAGVLFSVTLSALALSFWNSNSNEPASYNSLMLAQQKRGVNSTTYPFGELDIGLHISTTELNYLSKFTSYFYGEVAVLANDLRP